MRPDGLRPAPREESTADHVSQVGEMRQEDQRDKPAPDHRSSVGTVAVRAACADRGNVINALTDQARPARLGLRWSPIRPGDAMTGHAQSVFRQAGRRVWIATVSMPVVLLSLGQPVQGADLASAPSAPRCGGQDGTIVGTDGPDALKGTSGDDVIVALGGKDVVIGHRGNDVICGGDGADVLLGNRGDDTVYGGLDGPAGARGDSVDGGRGNDTMYAGADPDDVRGAEYLVFEGARNGVDVLMVAGHSTGYATGQGHDTFVGFNSVFGSAHADTITTYPDRGIIHSLEGDDVIRTQGRWTHISSGDGDDRVFGMHDIHTGKGDDTITLAGASSVRAGQGDDRLTGSVYRDDAFGGRGDDVLGGKRHWDRLNGGRGNDLLRGGIGADHLRGGLGADRLRGGRGNDDLSPGDRAVHDAAAIVSNDCLEGGEGRDIVDYYTMRTSGVRVDLGAGRATLVGNDRLSSIENAIGGGVDDVLRGGAGPNVLEGTQGADVLRGRGGNDRLIPDDSFSSLRENDVVRGGAGEDWVNYDIYKYVGPGLVVDLVAGLVTGSGRDTVSGIEDVIGGEKGDQLFGDGGHNVLDGRAGDDDIRGRGGVDIGNGGPGDDHCIVEIANNCES
jgi:Ca2+-binding RTX toxin-like protein